MRIRSILRLPTAVSWGLAFSWILVLSLPLSSSGTVYIHRSPAQFKWDPPSAGAAARYNVYVSVNKKPFSVFTSVPSPSCTLPVEDLSSYVVRVEAVSSGGTVGPMSDPSEEVVVYLKGTASDTDGDGMPNTWELNHGLNPFDPSDASQDSDTDGLTNAQEYQYGTDPRLADTDHDGVSDREEIARGMNPLSPEDNMPVADAGPDQTLTPTVVTLDGSASRDPNGLPLSFSWSQSDGKRVNLSNASAVRPTFLAKKTGDYVFELIVSNGRAASAPDKVTIHITNVRPTADAGALQTVTVGTQVVLDGSASSDPNEDPLSFSWSQARGRRVALQGAGSAKASFVPSESGTYEFQLVVSDGELESPPARVFVVANGRNHVPHADAGSDQTGRLDHTVTLDGSGSTDEDGDALQFHWSQIDGPEPVVLQGASEMRASFSPPKVGIYRFELLVNDGKDTSPPDTVAVTVENDNRQPVASVRPADQVSVGDWVVLDGSESYDPDNDRLTYRWSQEAGAQVTLVDGDAPIAGFYAIAAGTLEFTLVVDDGELPSAPARVQVRVVEPDEQAIRTESAPRSGSGGCSVFPHDWGRSGAPGNRTDPSGLAYIAILLLPALVCRLWPKRRKQ